MLYKGKYKVIIIGSGPSGVTCSLYLKRASIDHLVISDNSSALKENIVENYYGFSSIKAKDLYEIGNSQIKDNLLIDEVIDIKTNDCFRVITKDNVFECEYLVLALGIKNNKSIFDKFIGCGVSVCAHCDAPMFKNKKIYYTGVSPYIEELEKELRLYSSDLELIKFEDIDSLIGNEYLEEVRFKNGSSIKPFSLFLGLPISSNKLTYTLGLIKENNKVKVDECFRTNINKMYAIGDMACKTNHIAYASYSGMECALDLIERIKNE